MENTTLYWGYHLQIEAKACDPDLVTNPDYIEKWVKDLVKQIKMVPYGEPQIVHFGKDEPMLAGWTAIQLIETSNIIAHFCDMTGDLYLDVFSCKEYDYSIPEEHLKRWFNPVKIKSFARNRCARSED